MIALILHYKYFILAPLTLIEGPLVMMVSGLLLRLGYFSFLPLYLCLVISDFAGDIVWYWIGYHFGNRFTKKFGRFFSITEEGVAIVEKLYHEHHNKILIISKLTTGFGFAVVTLFTAGMVKIPFKRYALLNFIGEFIWTGLLLSVGYYLGEAYVHVDNIIGKFSIVAMIIVVFLALFGFGKYLKGRLTKAYSI